ncbi:MAG: hypothetical protein NTV30_09435, partial [Chloroflexi bacterium]|nr:hypothetical protein [Chloroflexota bacterium]
VDVGSPFQVEPGQLSAEPVNEVSKGMRNARIGSRGYTLATVAGIVINVPATTISGNYTVKVTIVADWKSQTGQVSISQTRDFVYTIAVN